jgi:2-polyprenyl-3-methyl-5-hydroxy-6-metoxy-1,4-benzoquinol methylase
MKSNSYVECPICGTEVKKDGFIEAYKSPFNNQKYELYECPECELQWWEPLKMVPEFYENEVFDPYVSFHEGIRSRMGKNHEAFFSFFPKDIKGKLLDIGCGDGIFLKEAKKQGFEVWGIDFDRKSVKVVKKTLRVNTIYPMSLGEFHRFAKKRNLKFDVITFFEVLEHQDKPIEFLNIVKSLLKNNGYIAGSVEV